MTTRQREGRSYSERRDGTVKSTQRLHDAGQSLWLDNITRRMLTGGNLGNLELRERVMRELSGAVVRHADRGMLLHQQRPEPPASGGTGRLRPRRAGAHHDDVVRCHEGLGVRDHSGDSFRPFPRCGR